MSTGKRPVVALIGPMPPTKGGVTTFMLNLMASPLCESYAFLPYTTTRPPKKNVIDNWGYGAVLRGGLLRILHGLALTVWRLAKFPFFVLRKRVDLVQIQASDYQVFWESVAYALLARLLRRPVVFRIGGAFDLFHGGSSPPLQRLIGLSLRLPQCVVAQSEFSRDYIRKAGRDGHLVVLSNWSRDPVAESAERPPTVAPTFLFIAGTEARRKGVEEVLAAAQQLSATGCPARFHMVAMTPGLIERATALQLRNIAAMEGPVERPRMLELMRRLDVFLLPSHGEGFPNSLIEAMACGMASIVTPVAAVPEIVATGGALTVPVGDGAALAAAIDRLARDAGLRRQLADQALSAVRSRYTAATVLPALDGAYRRLLA
jgi:glycosyltransferase involved in cell wall biosynthesis